MAKKSPYVHEHLDDDEILPDGGTRRVPMMMRDAAARSFGHDDSLALHRPGQRFTVDAAARARVEAARAQGIREMCDAWQRKPDADSGSGYGSGEFRGQQPGDMCTVNGAAGHLNHRLECIPDRQDSAPPRTMDAAAAQKIRDAAWEESVRADENAWRGPAR